MCDYFIFKKVFWNYCKVQDMCGYCNWRFVLAFIVDFMLFGWEQIIYL